MSGSELINAASVPKLNSVTVDPWINPGAGERQSTGRDKE